MKDMTCLTCQASFQIKYSSALEHPNICQACQDKAMIDNLATSISVTSQTRDSLPNKIKELKEQYIAALDYSRELKDLWSYYIHEYETYDRDVAMMKKHRAELLARQQVKPIRKVKKSPNISPAEMALAALKSLPADQRAAILSAAQKL